jgi:hypothetical protein
MNLSPDAHAAPTGSLNLGLVRKYSIPGPRYTSYPPATKFTPELESLALEDAIADDNRLGAGPISLYFHLPFCETRCWFCGCNTVITRRRGSAAEYLDDLAKEVALTAERMDRTRAVTQIHLGGGTPTFFPPEEHLSAARSRLRVQRRDRSEAPDSRSCCCLTRNRRDACLPWCAGHKSQGATSCSSHPTASGERTGIHLAARKQLPLH